MSFSAHILMGAALAGQLMPIEFERDGKRWRLKRVALSPLGDEQSGLVLAGENTDGPVRVNSPVDAASEDLAAAGFVSRGLANEWERLYKEAYARYRDTAERAEQAEARVREPEGKLRELADYFDAMRGSSGNRVRKERDCWEHAAEMTRLSLEPQDPPVPSGGLQKEGTNVNDPEQRGTDPNRGAAAVTIDTAPGDTRLGGGSADSARDDRRAEGGSEEQGAGAGNHQAGGGASLGGRGYDGRVTERREGADLAEPWAICPSCCSCTVVDGWGRDAGRYSCPRCMRCVPAMTLARAAYQRGQERAARELEELRRQRDALDARCLAYAQKLEEAGKPQRRKCHDHRTQINSLERALAKERRALEEAQARLAKVETADRPVMLGELVEALRGFAEAIKPGWANLHEYVEEMAERLEKGGG